MTASLDTARRLRALAELAETQGPRFVNTDAEVCASCRHMEGVLAASEHFEGCHRVFIQFNPHFAHAGDKAFTRACDPATILGLVEVIERYEKALERIREIRCDCPEDWPNRADHGGLCARRIANAALLAPEQEGT